MPRVLFKAFESIAARTAEEGLVILAASPRRETHGICTRAGEVQDYAPIAKDDTKATHD